MTFDGGSGRDYSILMASEFRGNVMLDLGDGDDAVSIALLTAAGKVTIDCGGGNDENGLYRTVFSKGLRLLGGTGDDAAELSDCSGSAASSLAMSDGNDQVTFSVDDTALAFSKNVTVDGGKGTDTLTGAPTFSGNAKLVTKNVE